MTEKPTAKVKSTYSKLTSDTGEVFDEKIKKVNDYSISLTTEEEMAGAKTCLKRVFNFEHAEIDETFVAHSENGLSTTKTKTEFRNLSSFFEVARMHEELIKRDGHPPELGSILPDQFVRKEPRKIIHGFLSHLQRDITNLKVVKSEELDVAADASEKESPKKKGKTSTKSRKQKL